MSTASLRGAATADLSEAMDAVRRHVWPAARVAAGAGGLDVRQVAVGPVAVAWVRCAAAHDAAGVTLTLDRRRHEDRALVLAPVAGSLECWRGREHVAARLTGGGVAGVAVQAGDPVTVVRVPAASAVMCVTLPEALLADALHTLTGRRRRVVLALAQPAGVAGWARLVDAAAAAVDAGVLDHPAAGWRAADTIAVGLLTSARHDQDDLVRAAAPGPVSDRMRRALAWIHVHHGDPTIGPADIAAGCGVAERTLFRSFARGVGMTPRAYLRWARLVAVRAELRAADPAATTVAAVLARHGCVDLSWTAAQYQAVYGERPVDTLRGPAVGGGSGVPDGRRAASSARRQAGLPCQA
jgi:AraC-like DNA-binding protein